MNRPALDYSKFRLYWPPYFMCKGCHCTTDDCSVCVERTGEACYWVEPYLCSACVEQESPPPVYQKPPRGVAPRWLAEECEVPISERLLDVGQAIERYEAAGLPVPAKWIEELEEIIQQLVPPIWADA